MFKPVAAGLLLAALATFAAQSAYVIKGQVLDERGEAVRGVHVCAFSEGFDVKKPNSFFPCGWSDARGEFTIVARGPGKYTLHYDDEENGRFSSLLPFYRHPAWQAPEVSLDGAQPTASITVTMLTKNALLVGRGVDASTGQPIDKLEVILCHADAPNVCWQKHARSAEGKFQISAAYVPFTVRVRAEGYEDWLGPEGGEGAAPLSIAPGATRELSARLKRSGASEGRALSEAEKRPGVNLPAPAQTAPAEGAVFNYYPRRTTLEWSPVEGAVSYSVEIDFCSGRRRGPGECEDPQPLPLGTRSWAPGSDIVGTSYEFNFLGAQPGRWRVWAVDAQGREGFKSPWRLFVYLR